MVNFKSLSVGEKIFFAVLGVVLVLAVYMKMVREPFTRKMDAQTLRIKKYASQIKELSDKHPPLETQRARIVSLKRDNTLLGAQISQVEKKLPVRRDASQLIGEFTRLAKDIKLLAIRQKVVTEAGYSRILIEVTLSASYPDAIHYLGRLESISPFLRVEELEINESKGKSVEEGGAPVRLLVSSFLGESDSTGLLKASEEEPLPVRRDILISKTKPAEALNEKDFKLEGITYGVQTPTAIINGDVFRVDEEIKGFRIKEILPNRVVLTDGFREHLLTLNTS